MCSVLWGRDAFSSTSFEVWVVVVSFSEAKVGDNGVLSSQVARAVPQLLCNGGKIAFCSFVEGGKRLIQDLMLSAGTGIGMASLRGTLSS